MQYYLFVNRVIFLSRTMRRYYLILIFNESDSENEWTWRQRKAGWAELNTRCVAVFFLFYFFHFPECRAFSLLLVTNALSNSKRISDQNQNQKEEEKKNSVSKARTIVVEENVHSRLDSSKLVRPSV